MATKTQNTTGSEQDPTVEEKIERMRELFADGPDIGKTGRRVLLHALPFRPEMAWEPRLDRGAAP